MIATSLKPFFIGRSALDWEIVWHKFRNKDRWWHHLPFWAYEPFDCLCWIICSQATNCPIYRYLGGYRGIVPGYLSSLLSDSPKQFTEETLSTKKNILWFQLHPKDVVPQRDREGLVMEATELDFVLMSNPVVSMNLEEAIRFIRFLKT